MSEGGVELAVIQEGAFLLSTMCNYGMKGAQLRSVLSVVCKFDNRAVASDENA